MLVIWKLQRHYRACVSTREGMLHIKFVYTYSEILNYEFSNQWPYSWPEARSKAVESRSPADILGIEAIRHNTSADLFN